MIPYLGRNSFRAIVSMIFDVYIKLPWKAKITAGKELPVISYNRFFILLYLLFLRVCLLVHLFVYKFVHFSLEVRDNIS